MKKRKLNGAPSCTSRAEKIMRLVEHQQPIPHNAEDIQVEHPEGGADLLAQAEEFLNFVGENIPESTEYHDEEGRRSPENKIEVPTLFVHEIVKPNGEDNPVSDEVHPDDDQICGDDDRDDPDYNPDGDSDDPDCDRDYEFLPPGDSECNSAFEEVVGLTDTCVFSGEVLGLENSEDVQTESSGGGMRKEVHSSPELPDNGDHQAETDALHESSGEPVEGEERIGEEEERRTGSSEKKKHKNRGIFQGTKQERVNQKRKREVGEAYYGIRKDKEERGKWDYKVERASRHLRPPCSCKMSLKGKKLQCRKFSENERQRLHSHFWKNLTWEAKRTLVSSLVDAVKPTHLWNRKEVEKSRRSQTLKYHLKLDGKRQTVCSKQFFNTFDITFDFVSKCIKENREAIADNGIETEDDAPHGKELSSKARHQDRAMRAKVDYLEEKLKSLPRIESHYCRQNTSKFYLEPNTFRTKMDVYRFYKAEAEKDGKGVLSFTKFDEEYNRQHLSVYKPRKDQCDTCVSYNAGNCSPEDYEAHQNRKKEARKEKEDDNEGTHFVATLDMQGVLLCPTGFNASALYYKMKLCIHNFTVFNNKTRHVVCYIWHEAEGGVTSNEFATLYVNYIRRIAPTLEEGQDVILWSDGAGYQNRNQNLSNALLKLSSELNINIIQKYLEVGHTQMECDSIHATIERKLRNKLIYTPADYLQIIQNARINPSPYETEYIDHTQFMDYSKLGPMDSIRPGRTVGDPKVTDLRALKYTPSGKIFYKLSFSGNWTLLEKRKRKNSFEGVINRLFRGPVKIKEDKFRHLQDLKNVIPKDYHPFYDGLSH